MGGKHLYFRDEGNIWSNGNAVNKVTISVRPGCCPQPPDPEGTCPVGSPRRISRRVPSPLRGLEGGIQVRSIEDVKRMIALT